MKSGAGREKLVIVHQKIAATEEKKFLGSRRVKMRRSLNKANGVGSTRVWVPEGQREEHAGAKRRGVVGVAELKDVEEGKGG